MALICLHFEKMVKGYQYGYQMKALDLGVKNLLLLLFTFLKNDNRL